MMSNVEPNFFFVNRGLLHSTRWLSEPFTRGQAWVDLFGLAQHTKGFFRIRGIKITVNRGQLAYSHITLAKRWQWSRGKVRRYLKELEKEGDIIQQNNEVTTIITIIQYNKWQGGDTTSDTIDGQQIVQQTDNRRTTNGTTNGTHKRMYNNDNNDNKDKDIYNSNVIYSSGCIGKNTPIYTIEQVKDACILNEIPEINAQSYFDQYNSQGWKKANGQNITNLRSHIAKRWDKQLQKWDFDIKKDEISEPPVKIGKDGLTDGERWRKEQGL